MRQALLVIAALAAATPLLAKERLGAFQGWAAFQDPDIARCYAIGAPEDSNGKGYLSIGFWPKKGISHQIYAQLSRPRSSNSGITLNAGGRRFRLSANGNSGVAADRQSDMAIIAAIRNASSLSIESTASDGSTIIDAYVLRGAASAIDAAALGCAKR